MILQALADYYDRAEGIAPNGWEFKRIPFLLEICADGDFVQLTDRRSGPKATDIEPLLVPKGAIRTGTRSYEHPNCLWDHYGFVLGVPRSEQAKDRKSAELQFEHFQQRVIELLRSFPDSLGVNAIHRFYTNKQFERVFSDVLWPECRNIAGCNLTFRIAGRTDVVLHERVICDAFGTGESDDLNDSVTGVCLVTGETSPISKLNFPIAGIGEKPAPLCSTNESAYWSYAKEKGFGFPVGVRANFKYTTALNHMLRPGSRQKWRLGDATTVFWTDVPDVLGEAFGSIFAEHDDPNRTEELRALLQSIHAGSFSGARGDNRFFMLGLAPNAARIAVLFWRVASLREMAQRIVQWFADLEIVRGPHDPEFPSLVRLLSACAVQGKEKNMSPNLSGEVVRAILDGGRFPTTWLNAAIARCRAERDVGYYRAAAIKACITRNSAFSILREDIKPMLDTKNPNVAYRLGRLFAALEKIQEEANPGLNATIRERYYGAASSTPVTVFTTLLRLKNHHIAKIENKGRAGWFEKLIGQILEGVSELPAHLALPGQGLFAIGYYHQRQAFYTKRLPEESSAEE